MFTHVDLMKALQNQFSASTKQHKQTQKTSPMKCSQACVTLSLHNTLAVEASCSHHPEQNLLLLFIYPFIFPQPLSLSLFLLLPPPSPFHSPPSPSNISKSSGCQPAHHFLLTRFHPRNVHPHECTTKYCKLPSPSCRSRSLFLIPPFVSYS